MNLKSYVTHLLFLMSVFFVCLFSDSSQQPPDVHPQLPERGVEHHGEPQNRSLWPEGCGRGHCAQRKLVVLFLCMKYEGNGMKFEEICIFFLKIPNV